MATPPVAATSPERPGSVRFAERSSDPCRDLSELCQEAAAVEVATLLLGGPDGPVQSEAPAFQRAHAVANLLLSGGAAPATAASPPYLQRLWMLRRARRRVRAIRQVKQVLSLRDELLLRSAFSCWCNRSQLRRLVLCGRAISEASAAKREATQCCNDRSSHCMLASQVLMHWGLATARAIRGRPRIGLACREERQRRFDGLAAVVRRGEAACRLVLLYASLHAWSDCRRTPPRRPGSGLHGIHAANAKAWTSTRRLQRAVLLFWAHLTLRRRAQMQGERLAQESAELLRLQLHYLQLRHREAETFHSHRLVEGSFNAWLRVVEVNHEHRALRLYAKPRSTLARAPQRLRARFAAWRWLWQEGRRNWHLACSWHFRGEKGRRKDLLHRILLSWHSTMQDAWCFRAFEEACAEKYARSDAAAPAIPALAATARFGRDIPSTAESRSLSPSDTIFNSFDGRDDCEVGRTLSLSSLSPAS